MTRIAVSCTCEHRTIQPAGRLRRGWSYALAAGLVALALPGCGGGNGNAEPTGSAAKAPAAAPPEPEKPTFTQDTVADLLNGDENDIKGARVEDVIGRVFNVERGPDVLGVQMWTDPDNSEGNVVALLALDSKVREDDYLKITGEVADVLEGENAFGTELTAPRVAVETFDVVDATALDPPIRTYEENVSGVLGGVEITVRKLEISEKQTRVSVTYRNGSGEDFMESPSLVADGEEVEDGYSGDLKAPASSVSPGASTTGRLVFEAVDPDAKLRLRYTGYDENFDETELVFEYGGD